MTLPPLDRRYPLALVFAIGLVYSNSFAGVMLFDDHGNIINNPAVHSLASAWAACLSGDLRPLTTLTLAMNYGAGGLEVGGYHAFNIIVHLLATLTLFGLIRRTLHGLDGHRYAFAAALLWAIHPLQTESVTYIVQRAQCLVGLFLFLTLYSLTRSVDSPHSQWWRFAAVASCALGMASKQDMVVAPVVAILFDRIFLARSWREVVKHRWLLHLALFATWIVLWPSIRFAIIGSPSADPAPSQSMLDRTGVTAGFALTRITPTQYAMTQPGVILHYLGLTLWPNPLSFDYFDWPVVRTVSDAALPSFVLVLLLAATGFALFKRPEVGFLGAFFFLTLAPTSSILPIDDVVAERRMYLPSAALIALVVLVWGIAGDKLMAAGSFTAESRRLLDGLAFGAAALTLGILTFQRNEDYRSQVAMWTDVVAHRPENPRAWHNLAVSLVDENRRPDAVEPFRMAAKLKPDSGQYAALAQCLVEIERPAEAVPEFEKAIELLPTARGTLKSSPAMLHFNLAKALADSGRPEQAESRYRESLRLDSDSAAAHLNLGMLLLQRGESAEGIAQFRAALALEPDSALVHNNLGQALAGQAKYAEAIAELKRAVELEPGFVLAWDNLGTALVKHGDLPAAIAAYERGLAAQPGTSRVIFNLAHACRLNGDRDRSLALYREGLSRDPGRPRAAVQTVWVLAAHADARRRDPIEAVRLAELAVEATDRRDPICLDAAAAAYASAGRFSDAVESARAAIALFANQPRAADAVRDRLKLYERGEAYRDPP